MSPRSSAVGCGRGGDPLNFAWYVSFIPLRGLVREMKTTVIV